MTPNDISGAVLILGKYVSVSIACFMTGIWSVARCDDSIVLPYGSISIISFEIITGPL